MADKEINDLTDGGAVANGDLVHVVRSGNSRKVTFGDAAGKSVGTGSGSVAAGDDPRIASVLRMGVPVNFSLSASVSGNALTIAVKGIDGNDPSSTNPVHVPFRSATAASGDVDVVSLTGATSLVVSSGSTLGAPTGSVPFKLWVVAFNDAGTLRLGVILCTTLVSGLLTQYPLAAWGIASSTAEGGAGAADSSQTFYTGSAVTTKAYTVLGCLSFETGLSTAGTWAAAPTRVQVFDPSTPLPGHTVQRSALRDGASASGSVGIPIDNTIPQSSEGTQFMSVSITPSSAANVLMIDHDAYYGNNGAGYVTAALFKDSGADAISVSSHYQTDAGSPNQMSLRHHLLAGGTASQSFKIRAGMGGATALRINGSGTSATFGGAGGAFLGVEEVAA